jgi:poly(3-hydroxybutyrate) depolymerase
MAPPANDTGTMITAGMVPYILDLPPGYDNTKAYPLLFVWHGFGVDNASFHGYLNMKAVAGNDAIIVTPEIIGGGSMWPQDPSYFDGLYDHFTTKYCVDTTRVFTTGHSMGGMHTAMLGCQRANKLRGDAVLAAPHATGKCVDGNMALMLSVGNSDTVVSANHDTEFKWYAEHNGCDPTMSMPVDPMQCIEYAGCMPNKPVRTCRFDGGHEIPPWVAGAVWGFFKKL